MKSSQLQLFPELESPPTLRDVADLVRLAGIEGLPEAIRRADDARYQEVFARSALTKTSGMPFPWALNPYRGCTHACEYCYARKYQRHLELGVGGEFSSLILVKTNLPDVLTRELRKPRWAREQVAVGTATDPYQPIEGHYQITRRCLEALVAHETPFSIVTKGPMIVRDRDVLVEASRRAGCEVLMSVASVDDEAWSRLEPGTAHPRQRLKALRTLADAGVTTGVLMMPLMPGITTSQASIEATLKTIASYGIRVAGAAVGRLDPGVREYFFSFIARAYPELAAGYRRLYAGTHARGDYVREVKAAVTAARRACAPAVPGCEPPSADASRRDPPDLAPKKAS
ncbi:MAG: radical SAM protein [Vicinamibacterales bacterium]